MSEYPNWVVDLVNAVDKYEEEHAGGSDCVAEAFANVPAVVVQGARMVRNYVRNVDGEEGQPA